MTIYISNLGFNVGDSELTQLFEGYGEVSSAKVIIDRHSGRSKGFGFVEMSDDTAAQKAISELDQTEHDSKTLNVSEARPREEKPARSGYGGGDRRRGGYDDRRNNKRW